MIIVEVVDQSAAMAVWLAGSPLIEGVSCRCFKDCNEPEPYQPGGGIDVPPTASSGAFLGIYTRGFKDWRRS